MKKSLSAILAIILIFSTMLFMTACDGEKSTDGNADTITSQGVSDSSATDNVLGEGATEFTFTVTDIEGKEAEFEIHTDKTTVGDALLELELIAGDAGDYGLYVKTVNGITLDYDKDGKYWAFYVNGEYAQTGVDMTEITAGATYSFKAE